MREPLHRVTENTFGPGRKCGNLKTNSSLDETSLTAKGFLHTSFLTFKAFAFTITGQFTNATRSGGNDHKGINKHCDGNACEMTENTMRSHSPVSKYSTKIDTDEAEVKVCAKSNSRITNRNKSIKSTENRRQTDATRSANGSNYMALSVKLTLVFLLAEITMASGTPRSNQLVPSGSIQTFNVTEGNNVTIRFDNLECHQSAVPYFTLSYKSKHQPFCCLFNNKLIQTGLKERDQIDRFVVEGLRANGSFSVILNINVTSIQDAGTIEIIYMLLNYVEDIFISRKATIHVFMPPAKAECNFSKRDVIGDYYVVWCHAPDENGRATISCFQNYSKILQIGAIKDNNIMIRGIFWAQFGDLVHCCSHFTTDNATQETCLHSIFHQPKSILTTSMTPVFTNPYIETTKENPCQSDCIDDIDTINSSSNHDSLFMPWIPKNIRVITLVNISLLARYLCFYMHMH